MKTFTIIVTALAAATLGRAAAIPSANTTVETRDTTGTSASSSTDPAFIQSILNAHNEYRAIHGGASVTWDATKAQYAQNYAEQCTWAHSGGPYGENLAIGGFDNPEYYVWMWYNEREAYTDYSSPDFNGFESWGHFTQTVWSSTASIGCGFVTTCDNLGDFGPYFLVCEYDTGNVLPSNYFVSNVLAPKSGVPAAPAQFV
ncbi:putative venom allergen ame: allergendol m [Phaeomoniella chlamydospora]|uniref:Putative venom allergen ame: allergendol m n=1 Tax=Phaeomoniella chlamydospora TaxID=158046 RepID=A0A0G2EP38_PHACM|nr:putative venom allergen ame: allergendol m [Phaeomoniella chlamydospora]